MKFTKRFKAQRPIIVHRERTMPPGRVTFVFDDGLRVTVDRSRTRYRVYGRWIDKDRYPEFRRHVEEVEKAFADFARGDGGKQWMRRGK